MEIQEYLDRIEQQRTSGQLDAAVLLALECVNRFPDDNRARLLLARVFHARGLSHFAVREVELLHSRLPQSESVRKLLQELNPSAVAMTWSEDDEVILAEDEVSIDDIDEEGFK